MLITTRSLRAPALPSSLDDVQDLLQELWLTSSDVVIKDRVRFESAVVEIAANIIRHGRPGSEATVVTLEIEVGCDDQLLRAAFTDDGAPADVDLGTVAMPDDEAEGGRGLPLAAAVSDVLDYCREGAVNRWSVECRRSLQVATGTQAPGGTDDAQR